VTHRGEQRNGTDLYHQGILFFPGLAFVFGFNIPDIGLMMSGFGMVLIGVQEKPN
jgi:hypothetical protein